MAARQSYQYAPYIPGISKLMLFTGVIQYAGPSYPSGSSGTAYGRIGCWGGDDSTATNGNGLFWAFDYADGLSVNIMRLGTVTTVLQSAFNGNQLGAGDVAVTGVTPPAAAVDFTKSQIFWIDQEWLGVGSVRFGVVICDVFITCHTVTNYNVLTGPYTPIPNAPIRYEAMCSRIGFTVSVNEGCSSIQLETPDVTRIFNTSLGFASAKCSSITASTEVVMMAMRPRNTTPSYTRGSRGAVSLQDIGIVVITANDSIILRLYRVFSREGADVGTLTLTSISYAVPQSVPTDAYLLEIASRPAGTFGTGGTAMTLTGTPQLIWTGAATSGGMYSLYHPVGITMGVSLDGDVDQYVITTQNVGSGTFDAIVSVNWSQES
jgi:hypothetical protein